MTDFADGGESSLFSDRVRFEIDAMRLIAGDAGVRLWERGWELTDPDAPDEGPLEWFWPPTAPLGYGGRAFPTREGLAAAIRERGGSSGEPYWNQRMLETPWVEPTRVIRAGSRWWVEYGCTTKLKSRRSQSYSDDRLIEQLERIECWPLSVRDTEQLRMERVWSVTIASATNRYNLGVRLTEPYASRLAVLDAHRPGGTDSVEKTGAAPRLPMLFQGGDLSAQYALVDAEAYASMLRTDRLW